MANVSMGEEEAASVKSTVLSVPRWKCVAVTLLAMIESQWLCSGIHLVSVSHCDQWNINSVSIQYQYHASAMVHISAISMCCWYYTVAKAVMDHMYC